MQLLSNKGEEEITITANKNYFVASGESFKFTTTLIEGAFPNYKLAIPTGGEHVVHLDKEAFKQALTRVAILANEKFRGVNLVFEPGSLRIVANNSLHEEAKETMPIEYSDQAQLEVNYNIDYLLGMLATIDADKIRWTFKNADSGSIVDADDANFLYVIMPFFS